MKHTIIILLAFLPLVAFGQLNKQISEDWTFVDQEESIKIYTRLSDSTNLKELRILVEMTGDIDTLLYIINDANNFGDWVYKCSKSAPLKVPHGYQSAYVATTDFPFPLCDRELVAISQQWIDKDGKFITHGVSAYDYTPLTDGLVRISHYESTWQIEKLDNNKIFIDYNSSVDPGGNIPNWVVNLAITTGPLKTFAKLSELVENRSDLN